MTTRTSDGDTMMLPVRLRLHAAIVLVVLFGVVGFGAGRLPPVLAEGDGDVAGEPVPADPLATVDVELVEPTPILDPTATVPPTEVPPTEAPLDVPTATVAPTPDEGAVADPVTPESTPTPTDPPGAEPGLSLDEQGVHSADESTATGIATCSPTAGASEVIAHGDAVVYDCVYQIVVASVPVAFAVMDLEWAVTAEVDSGWSVELRRHDEAGNGDEEEWTSGAEPGLVVVESLASGDDTDGVIDDGMFTRAGHFGLRLTAPVCGGPTDPTVTLLPSALSNIDEVPGTRIQGEPIEPVQPTLAVVAPGPTLVRSTTGGLNDLENPLRVSHADQVVEVGTMSLTVASGYCGGWTVSMSATDFIPAAEGVGFGAEHLMVSGIVPGAGAPVPAASFFHMSNAPQSVVAAQGQSLGAGTYAYDLNLELTIPGGTPPGTYTSTVTITTSAAP